MISLQSDTESHRVVSSSSKNYNGIDLVKFLCAILVFMIHIPLFQNPVSEFWKNINYGLRNGLCRLAVPFYFAVSGFFLFKKMPLYEVNIAIIKNYCFKILQLLGIWHILLLIGGTGHLWYLGATVIAVILLSLLFYYHIQIKYIGIFASLFYVVGLLGDSYYGVIEPLEDIAFFNYIIKGYSFAFSTTRNGVFMGFPFVFMGAIFAHYNFPMKKQTALAGLTVSILSLFVEAYLLKYYDLTSDNNMYICLLPATFFLLWVASSVQLKDYTIYKHLRRIGILVYFSHLLINEFAWLGISVINKFCGVDLSQYQFVLSLCSVLAFAICFEWLSYKDKFKWFNLFIS